MHLAGITIEGPDLIKGGCVRLDCERCCPNTHDAYLHLDKKMGTRPRKGICPLSGCVGQNVRGWVLAR